MSVLTVASWSAYRFLKKQIRWSGIPISYPQCNSSANCVSSTFRICSESLLFALPPPAWPSCHHYISPGSLHKYPNWTFLFSLLTLQQSTLNTAIRVIWLKCKLYHDTPLTKPSNDNLFSFRILAQILPLTTGPYITYIHFYFSNFTSYNFSLTTPHSTPLLFSCSIVSGSLEPHALL